MTLTRVCIRSPHLKIIGISGYSNNTESDQSALVCSKSSAIRTYIRYLLYFVWLNQYGHRQALLINIKIYQFASYSKFKKYD